VVQFSNQSAAFKAIHLDRPERRAVQMEWARLFVVRVVCSRAPPKRSGDRAKACPATTLSVIILRATIGDSRFEKAKVPDFCDFRDL